MRRIIATGMIVSLLTASPAFADTRAQKRGKAIAKWALIGAGTGFALGFVTGMKANEHKPYAEERTWRAAWLAALAGGTLGGVVGATRATQGHTPRVGRPLPSLPVPTWPRQRLQSRSAAPDRIYRGLFGGDTIFGSAPRAATPRRQVFTPAADLILPATVTGSWPPGRFAAR